MGRTDLPPDECKHTTLGVFIQLRCILSEGIFQVSFCLVSSHATLPILFV